ncbi:MAG: DUF3734 domain-containing protein [Pigmentiphaga sp.]
MNTRPPFECIALLLQGGGALGSYQAGVYQALAEAGLHPDWVAGISIGAINSALIAGNPPEKRVDALRAFWESITTAPPMPSALLSSALTTGGWNLDLARGWINQMWAFSTLLGGAPGFFRPRAVSPFLVPKGTEGAQSFYDTRPLRATLERLVDFDRINAGGMRFSVGAVNVTTGNFVYFDTATHAIDARHVMASGALPPGFPAVEIDGESYWDGGLVSNTPLQWVLESRPRQDTLAFQVDLWSAAGEYPQDLVSQDVRLKDIRFSSRTRHGTDQFRKEQGLRRALARLLEQLPDAIKNEDDPELRKLIAAADDKVYNIAHLIYRAKSYEGASKDYEFSRATMQEHWNSGYEDAVLTLRRPEVLQRPGSSDGVATFDVSELRESQQV